MAVQTNHVEDVISQLCEKLRCTDLANDLKRLNHARDMLYKLQLSDTKAFDEPVQPCNDNMSENCTISVDEQCEEAPELTTTEFVDSLENKWQGHFHNYQILTPYDKYSSDDERKCVELPISMCCQEIEYFLRKGVRCFLIDLFMGTNKDNQSTIVRLRSSELKVSKEFGFPVRTTLLARLSPRLQYTGQLDDSVVGHTMEAGDVVTLTTNRQLSACSTHRCIYVNANFLLNDLQKCDVLLFGVSIQLSVISSPHKNKVNCKVIKGGILQSRMPVLFPGRCQKFRISLEELEDITFCKEVGINVIISHSHGSEDYLKDFQDVLQKFACNKMRLGVRLSINELAGCDDDLNWIADGYDMFLLDIKPNCAKDDTQEILHLCPAVERLIQRMYLLKKPIIFDGSEIGNKHFVINPEDTYFLFHHPDRYLIKCNNLDKTFYFFQLQSHIFDPLPTAYLSEQPFCDTSLTGSDTLARALAILSLDTSAPVILVCSITGLMAQKISHFRPKAHILLISCMASAADFISMHWNVTVLYFKLQHALTHRKSVSKQLLFGLLYAKSRRLIRHLDNVIFVFGTEPGTKFPDEYHLFRFDEQNFAEDLSKMLF